MPALRCTATSANLPPWQIRPLIRVIEKWRPRAQRFLRSQQWGVKKREASQRANQFDSPPRCKQSRRPNSQTMTLSRRRSVCEPLLWLTPCHDGPLTQNPRRSAPAYGRTEREGRLRHDLYHAGCFSFVTGWWWQTASDKRSWSECRTATAGQCREAERSDVLPMSHTSTHKRNALIEGRLFTILSSLLWICILRLNSRLLASGWLKRRKQNGEERKIKFYCGENGFFLHVFRLFWFPWFVQRQQ